MFRWIDPRPLGSASIAQAHRATTREGDAVIIKLVKPGIRETLRRDAILLRMFGRFLQIFLARYQPRRVADEFVAYTLREADLQREADNAETFQANFEDMPGVVFPKIYRRYSAETVLCMEYINGIKPTDPRVGRLSETERDKLIDLGASAIIRMLYKDGFFHADLHPANLLILDGPRAAFIDLGMVGRFDDRLRRILLYYFYCLVMGDSDNAARYLTAIAEPGPGANPTGFRREVEEISRRWSRHSRFHEISIAQLILQSVGKAGHFRMYFPMEMVLMVKALVTYEGVGHLLKAEFDVAAVSRQHINRIFISQFSPLRIAREGLRGAPELVDALVKAPMLVTEGLRYLEKTTRAPAENPLSGVRGTLYAGFCLVGATILIAFGGPWPLWTALLLLSLVLILRRGR
jgi:ubiquinone biosynthesis protein